MKTAGVVVLVIILALLAAGIGWVVFTRIRAQRLGLPAPSLKSYIPFLNSSTSSSSSYGGPAPAPGGIVGWFSDRIRLFRNRNTRTAAGAYEGQGSSSSYNAGYASTNNPNQSRGFGPLDPDDAWDARVGGYNPYEEERELGLVPPPPGGHGGGGGGYRPDGEGYQMNLAIPPSGGGASGEVEEERRGRTRSRSPGPGEHQHQQQRVARGNPFEDDAEPSNISLRGVSPRPMDSSFAGRKAAKKGEGDHDTDRRSIFREEV